MSTPKPQIEQPQEQHVDEVSKSWPKLEYWSQLGTRISIIIGVIAGLYGFYESRERAQFAAQTNKLQSLSYIQNFIKEDFDVQQTITNFDYGQLPVLETKAAQGGRRLYFSKDIGDVLSIGEHYERMGAEIKLGYLDFNLVFEVVPFPDEFWENTRKLRTALRDHWSGNEQLPDLWDNFASMCELYRERRHRLHPGVVRPDHDPGSCRP